MTDLGPFIINMRHTKCRSDIVTSRDGKTAEMISTRYGSHECARLVDHAQGLGLPGHVGPADQAYLQGVSGSQLVDAIKSRCKVPSVVK